MDKIEKDGKVLPYIIIHKKNKHTYFRVKNDGVYITTSSKNKTLVKEVLLARFDYFYETYIKLVNKSTFNNQIKLENKIYNLEYVESKKFSYKILEDIIIIYGQKDKINVYIRKIYLNHLTEMLKQIIGAVNETIIKNGINPRPIKLKYLKSKFGSYHRIHDEITLNTFLATQNIKYLEYVLYHEYAHVKHFDHSKAFYDFLKKLMNDYEIYHNALKKIAII